MFVLRPLPHSIQGKNERGKEKKEKLGKAHMPPPAHRSRSHTPQSHSQLQPHTAATHRNRSRNTHRRVTTSLHHNLQQVYTLTYKRSLSYSLDDASCWGPFDEPCNPCPPLGEAATAALRDAACAFCACAFCVSAPPGLPRREPYC